MNDLSDIKIKEWLNDSIITFSKEISPIDIAFITENTETRSLILVFGKLPESHEDVIYKKIVYTLENSYYERKSDENWQFNIRMFDKSVFLYNISKFDPDILQYFVNDVYLFVGKEYYDSIKDRFFKENFKPELGTIILPYLEDVLLAWEDAHKRYISLDIQLTRCFFNSLKLYYSLTEDQNNLNLTNISCLTDYKKSENVFNNIDFIADKPEIGFSKKILYSIFFGESTFNILEKQVLVEEFQTQLLEWIFIWIENNYNKGENSYFILFYRKLKSFIEDSNLKDRFKFDIMRAEKNFGEIFKSASKIED